VGDQVLIAPSILSADFTRMAEAVELIETGGADFIHVDVMDGHFVPNLTIGPPVVKALKAVSTRPLDVHLMIDNVDDTIGWYLDAGADWVSVHPEACYHLHRVIRAIRDAGAKAGVALNPATSVDTLREVIGELDYVLLMSVNPGFGGQAFIPRTVTKIRELVRLCEVEHVSPIVEIDGGITTETAPLVAAQGARMLVAGNAVFGASDPVAAMSAIRAAAVAAVTHRSV
jgi:ribulose-phosphate 3-epimerase